MSASNTSALRLNLGCGSRQFPDHVNVDKYDTFKPDQVADLEQFPWPWEDDSVSEVKLIHTLEHLGGTTANYFGIIKELYRVCRDGAEIMIVVPHPRHDHFLNDPTHLRSITEGGLALFNQHLNHLWLREGVDKPLLGLQLQVDFALESVTYDWETHWREGLAAKTITLAEAMRDARRTNNVVRQTTFTLKARKLESDIPRRRANLSADYLKRLERAFNAQSAEEDGTARVLCEDVVALFPERADGWAMLGVLSRKYGAPERAEAQYRRAIAEDPTYMHAHNNLGNLLRDLGRPLEAVECYERALALQSDWPGTLDQLASAYQDAGQLKKAIAQFDELVERYPDYADGHWDRALALLKAGRYQEGWAEYEWRFERRQPVPRAFPQPRWQGESLQGKRLLIYAEQGFGDALQFLQFIKLLHNRGATLYLELRDSLVTLVEGFAGVDQVIEYGKPLPEFDLHVPLLSLPHILGVELADLPADQAYLKADPYRIKHWQEHIETDKPAVGFVWAGNPNVKNDRWRSPRLHPLLPLFEHRTINFYALQKGDGCNDLKTLENRPDNLVVLSDEIGDFADTAAIIAQMDVVITTDTSVAHLAGAMGKSVWIMLHYACDWRWLEERDDSPWYPSVRLFRQPRLGDWASVVTKISTELTALCQRKRQAG